MRGVGRRGGREFPQVWVRGRIGALAMGKRAATIEELLERDEIFMRVNQFLN